jgi:hypothetical protein
MRFAIATFAAALAASTALDAADRHARDRNVQLGPRPFFLVAEMQESALQRELLSCSNSFRSTPGNRTRPPRGWVPASSNAT